MPLFFVLIFPSYLHCPIYRQNSDILPAFALAIALTPWERKTSFESTNSCLIKNFNKRKPNADQSSGIYTCFYLLGELTCVPSVTIGRALYFYIF